MEELTERNKNGTGDYTEETLRINVMAKPRLLPGERNCICLVY
jgi:hypothetical protein